MIQITCNQGLPVLQNHYFYRHYPIYSAIHRGVWSTVISTLLGYLVFAFIYELYTLF